MATDLTFTARKACKVVLFHHNWKYLHPIEGWILETGLQKIPRYLCQVADFELVSSSFCAKP